MNTLIIPDMGNAEAAEIIEILITVGEQVEQEQSTIVLESEKATIEVPATASGKIEKLLVKVGDKIGSGESYAEISATVASTAEESTKQESTEEKPVEKVKKTAEPQEQDTEKTRETAGGSNEEQQAAASSGKSTTTKSNLPTEEQLEPSLEEVHAGPAVRKLARELGVSLQKVTATGLKGRIQKDRKSVV